MNIQPQKDAFAGLPECDLDDLISSAKKPIDQIAAAPMGFIENCPKCRGTGRFISYSGRTIGPCFTCKGKGTRTFKKSATARADTRQKAADRAAKRAADGLAAFEAANPAIAAWWAGSDFPFAIAMREAVTKYGDLTERQMAAALGCIDKLNARKAEAAARVVNAQVIDTAAIQAAFAKASQALKAPRLVLAGFTITVAKAASKNAGALYVKGDDGAYLGKIADGKFFASRECGADREAGFRAVAADPKAAAIKYGRLTGRCACCDRELTNAESIERGIGPICAERFGF